MHTGAVHGLRCRSCIAFGREEKVGSKRKTNQGSGQTPFRYDNIKNHVRSQHPVKWSEYEEAKTRWKYASRYEESNKFFAEVTATARSHFRTPVGLSSKIGAHPLIFAIQKGIIDVIIGEMMYAPSISAEDRSRVDEVETHEGVDVDTSTEVMEENVSSMFCSVAEREAVAADRRALAARAKEQALSLFELVDLMPGGDEDTAGGNNAEQSDAYKYVATITKPLLFDLAVRYISCGSSFRMAERIMRHTVDVFGTSQALNRQEVSRMMRVACASNLQIISDLLIKSWSFSIAIDSATHQSTSSLDLRFRVYSQKHRCIFNFHGCAIPMHERHTGEVMWGMLCKFLSIFCPRWQISMLGVDSDVARNMTGRAAGVVTRLQNYMHEDCPLLQIWCGAHQLDLVMEHVMTNVVGNSFFNVMLRFIAYLGRQQKLIADMGTTCPRVVNRWLSTYKVTNWFKLYRPQLLQHIKAVNPPTAPSRLWWVYLLAMHSFTNYAAATFRYVQGATTLVLEQTSAFQKLINTFKEDVGIMGPLTREAIQLLDPNAHMSSGMYSVSTLNIREYLCGLARWVEGIINENDAPQQQQLLRDIGSVFAVACDRINSICVLRNRDNSPYVDELSLPPVLPKDLVEPRPRDFLRMVCDHSFRLEHFFTGVDVIDLIADEHKELIMQYRTNETFKLAIDCSASSSSGSGDSTFADAWNALGSNGFRNLTAFCGGIATLFPGTCTVESDFSVLRWEKDNFRKNLSDFGLEAVLQAKQFHRLHQLSTS
jgi:hypothetical protein